MILYHGSNGEWNILRFGKRNITKIFILDFIAHDIRNKQNDGLRDMEKGVC